MAEITTFDALDAAVGARPPHADLKVIRHLDEHCATLLAHTSYLVVGWKGDDGAVRTTSVGGPLGFAEVDAPQLLGLPGLADDRLEDGAPVGVLGLVPGYGETLRVNGRLRLGERPTVEVQEAFVHCAKAIIRSKLWASPVEVDAPASGETTSAAGRIVTEADDLTHPAVAAFVDRCPFVLLSSEDGRGGADVSPKGDPAGFLQRLGPTTLALPDRPGNLRTDTFRNVLHADRLGLLGLIPGDDRVLELSGAARLSADPDLLATMEVNGKVPAAALILEVDEVALRRDPALAAAALWDRDLQVDKRHLPRSARIWIDHIAITNAEVAKLFPSEDEFAAGLETNYEEGLY